MGPSVSDEEEGEGRLGRAIRLRLAGLHLSAKQLAAAGYIAPATAYRILGGRDSIRDARKLERGLGWLEGSVDQVLAGGEPTSVIDARSVLWPRPDRNWGSAIEEAWAALEQVDQDQRRPEEQPREAGSADEEWLAQRTAEWPSWLTERFRHLVAEEGRRRSTTGKMTDAVTMLDRIIAFDHFRDLLAAITDWSERNRPPDR
jgi:transcriptional regulator with XRE-family HTH domain